MLRRVLAAGALVAAGCGGPTMPSSTTALRLVCPASLSVQSADGEGVVVTFAPSAIPGVPPVSATCAPSSGSTFSVGTTAVACTATDAQQQKASCAFSVAVAAPPRLAATKFVAFGDSITRGVSAACVRSATGVIRWLSPAEDLRHLEVRPAIAYPTRLQVRLDGRYTAQTPTVANEGLPGESVISSSARSRLMAVLDSQAPDVLLLQEGVNDLHGYGAAGIPLVADSLRLMVREGTARGLHVFLGTLLPEREGGCRAGQPGLIAPANDLIRAVAAEEGVALVDLHAAFAGDTGTLLGEDGLHPSEAGYEKIAETFFNEIRARLETSLTLSRFR